jgi:glycosyltransferase involved in cell wall biosynthesis
MKIIFLTGSAEPGKDGVGDYTRRLCGELIRAGHEAHILSLCDQQATIFNIEFQETEGTKVEINRIPLATSNTKRSIWAKKVINAFEPDWISLQYVPYSFNPKGLPFWLPSFLKKIRGNHKWQIMFHELWIGMESNASFKHKCIGSLQKQIVTNFFKKLDIKVINTQTELYQSKIAALGYNAEIFPLISNIEKNRESNLTSNNEEFELKFCFFGGIHHGAPVEKFIDELKQVLLMSNDKRDLKFIFIGNCGNAIGEWKKVLLSYNINFEITGFVTDEEISVLLSGCQYGISTTPYMLSQKSGSLAAMFDHQLPVLCVARNWGVKGFNQPRFLNLLNYETAETINNFLHRKFIVSTDNNLEFVTMKFLKGLK